MSQTQKLMSDFSENLKTVVHACGHSYVFDRKIEEEERKFELSRNCIKCRIAEKTQEMRDRKRFIQHPSQLK